MQPDTGMANPKHTRSPSATGRSPGLDGRSRAARRLRDLSAELLHGIPAPTIQQRALADRIAGLRFAVERQEAMLAKGDARYEARLHQRLVGSWLRALAALQGKPTPVTSKAGPRTLEDVAKIEGWDLSPDVPRNKHVNRFAKAVLDEHDEARRVSKGNDDAPRLAKNRERDTTLAKLAAAPRPYIKRRRIRERKP